MPNGKGTNKAPIRGKENKMQTVARQKREPISFPSLLSIFLHPKSEMGKFL